MLNLSITGWIKIIEIYFQSSPIIKKAYLQFDNIFLRFKFSLLLMMPINSHKFAKFPGKIVDPDLKEIPGAKQCSIIFSINFVSIKKLLINLAGILLEIINETNFLKRF